MARDVRLTFEHERIKPVVAGCLPDMFAAPSLSSRETSEVLADRQCALLRADQGGDLVGAGLAIEPAAQVGRRREELVRQDPHIDYVQVLLADIEFAVLASRTGGEDVVVILPQLIDLADRVDVRQRPTQHERP